MNRRLPFPSRAVVLALVAGVVVLGAPAAVLIAADDDPQLRDVASPTRVDDSGRAAARAVESVLGRDLENGRTVLGASCAGGACSVRYSARPRGEGVMRRNMAAIMEGVFADDAVDRVTLYVHHQVVGRKKDERAAFGTVTCDRATFERDGCDEKHTAGGKQRALMQRGKLTPESASRGEGE